MQVYVCNDFRHHAQPTLLVCVRDVGARAQRFHCYLMPRRSDVPRDGVLAADDFTIQPGSVWPCTGGTCTGLKIFPGSRQLETKLLPLPVSPRLHDELLRCVT